MVYSRTSLHREVVRILESNGKAETAQHLLQVAAEAQTLSHRFSADAQKAETAALLHDISCVIPNEHRVELAAYFGLTLFPEEIHFPMIIHQRLSKEIALRYFSISDEEVLEAIGCHTTLRANPTLVDMIVFLADKIAWDQEGAPPYLPRITEGLNTSPARACLNFINYLLSPQPKLKVIHPWLSDAHSYLLRTDGSVSRETKKARETHGSAGLKL